MPMEVLRYNGTTWTEANAPASTIDSLAGSVALGTTNYEVPSSNVRFVSPSGSDGNNGQTIGAPFATVAAAITACPAGGTVVCREGSYFVGTDTQGGTLTVGTVVNKTLTIQNYPNETVWFDGSGVVTGFSLDGSSGYYSAPYNRLFDRTATWVANGSDGVGAGTGAGGYFTTTGQEHASWPDMIMMDGVQLKQVQNKSDLGVGKFWVEGATTNNNWFQATDVWLFDNPTSHEIRAAMKTRMMAVTGDDVTIRGIGIRRYAPSQPAQGCLYYGGADGSVLENVVVEDISNMFVYHYTAVGATITRVTTRRTGFNAFGASRSDNLVYDGLDVQNVNDGANGAVYNVSGPTIAGIKVSGIQGITVKNSRFKNIKGSGVWFDQTVANPHVYTCWIENCEAYGTDFEGTSGGICADVVMKNIGKRGLYHHDSDELRSWNITIMNAMTSGGTGGQFLLAQTARNPYDSQWSFMIDSRLPAGYYDQPNHQFHVHNFEVCNIAATMPAATQGGNGTSMWYMSANNDTWGQTNFTTSVTKTMGGNLWWWNVQPQYPFVVYNYNQSATIYYSMGTIQSAQSIEANSTLLTGPANNPLNADGQVINAQHHTKARALPSDIAALIGRPAGTKRIGAFLVGDPT